MSLEIRDLCSICGTAATPGRARSSACSPISRRRPN